MFTGFSGCTAGFTRRYTQRAKTAKTGQNVAAEEKEAENTQKIRQTKQGKEKQREKGQITTLPLAPSSVDATKLAAMVEDSSVAIFGQEISKL